MKRFLSQSALLWLKACTVFLMIILSFAIALAPLNWAWWAGLLFYIFMLPTLVVLWHFVLIMLTNWNWK